VVGVWFEEVYDVFGVGVVGLVVWVVGEVDCGLCVVVIVAVVC